MKLDGKVALITGAASGIGHAIAKRYLEADGRVVIADLNAEGAAKSAKELTGEKSAIGVGMDVTKEDQVNAGVEQAVKAFGRIDILVSNAGIQIVHPIEDFPFADWKKLLAIHLDGAFLTTKACVKHMYKQTSGVADLYGIGTQPRGLAAQVGLCGGQARHPRPWPRHGERRGQAQCPGQCHLPGLRQDAARRKTDPRAGA